MFSSGQSGSFIKGGLTVARKTCCEGGALESDGGMTKAILLSDIELARRLVNADCRDEEVIAALCHRRLEAKKASLIVNDVRCGLRANPEMVALPHFKKQRRSHGSHPPQPTN